MTRSKEERGQAAWDRCIVRRSRATVIEKPYSLLNVATDAGHFAAAVIADSGKETSPQCSHCDATTEAEACSASARRFSGVAKPRY